MTRTTSRPLLSGPRGTELSARDLPAVARAARLRQLGDRPAALSDDRLGSALQVSPLGAEVDAQVAEDGGPEIGGGDAGFFHVIPLGVRAADHLAAGEAATGHEHRHAVEPVVPA